MTNIKIEALYILLSGFSKSCLELTEDKELPINKLAYAVHKHFVKSKMHYTTLQKKNIADYMNKTIEPKLEALGKSSPQILLILAIDLLVNEYKHLTTRLRFGHFDIDKMIDNVYSFDKYKKYIKSHSDFIGGVVS